MNQPHTPDRVVRATALMDETDRLYQRYQHSTKEHRTVQILSAMASHALGAWDASFRLYFRGPQGTGKTTAMKQTAALSANPRNVTGTTPAVRSLLAQHALEPKTPMPTLLLDQVEKYWGDSGMNVGAAIINDIAREGYQCDATMSWSANRKPVEFSIFCIMYMTGWNNLPLDIGERCIQLYMEKGKAEYFDMRTARPQFKRMGEALGAEVRAVAYREDPDIPSILEEFTSDGLHPRLTGRVQEVWHPLFAVAAVLGGQTWLNRCRDAFEMIELGGTKPVLSARQQLLKHVYELTTGTGPLAWAGEAGFLPGRTLARELVKDRDYQGRTLEQMEKYLGNTLDMDHPQARGLKKRDARYEADRMRVYPAGVVHDAWLAVRPETERDLMLPRFDSPFDVSDDSDGEIDVSAEKMPPPRRRSGGTGGTSNGRV